MNFKKTYTKEEAEELLDWMKNCKAKGSQKIREGVVVSDISLFLQNNQYVVSTHYENPNFAGQIQLIYELREALNQQQSQAQPQPDSSGQ